MVEYILHKMGVEHAAVKEQVQVQASAQAWA